MYFKTHILRSCFVLLVFVGSTQVFAQSPKQKQLETRRQELRREIQNINALRAENRSKEKSQLSLIEDFNYKISVLKNLIKVTNQQANLLTREINNNLKQIDNLRDELKLLKEDYAAMIVKSYKSRNQQSRIMFLLSSNDFKQAYKRLQYMKQYTSHQKEQGETIKAKTAQLQQINKDLQVQKEEKQKLIAENKKTQSILEKERAQHRSIMASIQKDLSKYTSQIKVKQREAARIDREIQRIVRAEIAKSNKNKTTSNNSSSFALTAEEKVLASNFVSNKGKLPWPVEKGFVKARYGKQPSLIDRSLTVQRNGVLINTEKNAKARVVFNGTVIRVTAIRNSNPMVMIKHGNYITVYKNLSKVYVKEGDKLKTKDIIGEVSTNSEGDTVLSFSIFKDAQTQNPASWIYRM
ncbi:murein hydrolase activator EnvC family protein [Hyunsoonleella ulvae]|uniref:murein hydrolase activator EnvC family protein n=1 Tax=Hyunsoonleella ulvae TaxID=2799948 RepID=UPI001939EF4C|nr:peptidoglycan DD-metalloendopeptidase family protein [Hyunsoonleella ulvae]